uniref:G-protein coupled receptors family 2 profile 1 domain-containing protein n=1 Tax=Amphimedon queenslandica TaxID=400682 RepID=A0A1X7TL03_AMPQE
MTARSTLLFELLSLATALSFSTAAQLSFINATDYNILKDIDDGCVEVELPGPLQFGGSNFTRAFLSSNGLVSFGKEFSSYYPVLFPLRIKIAILAPYWDDIILSEKRELRFKIFSKTSSITIEVNNFLTLHTGKNFAADWILWSYWCHCDLIKWTLHKAVVGFNFNNGFYQNHELSKSRDVVNIDCPDGSPSHFAIVVYKIDNVCNANTPTTNYGTFHWPTTLPGNTVALPCPNGPNGAIATRKCSENSIWESPDLSSCFTNTGKIQSLTINNTNIMPVLHNIAVTVNAITNTSDQNNGNIEAISNIFNQTATILSNTTKLSLQEVTTIAENTIEILQDIQEWPMNVVATQSNNIVKSFETITDALLNQGNVTDVTLLEQSIAFSGKQVMKSLYNGITFTASSISNALTIETVDNENNTSFTNDGELATIKLPESILNIINDEDDNINFAFTIYNQSILFPVQGSVQNTVVESPVIGARISGVADGTQLSDPVFIRLTLKGTPMAEAIGLLMVALQ